VTPRGRPASRTGRAIAHRRATLAVALLASAVACQPATSPGPSPATSAPEASPTAAASAPAPTHAPTGWLRSPVQASLADTSLRAVAWTGERFLATTWTGDSGIADSTDGMTWHPQPRFDTTARTSGPTILGIGPLGIIGIGGGSNGDFAVWRSTDGLSWEAAPLQPAFEPRDGAFQELESIVGTEHGWLAVGSEFYMCTPACPLRGLVLTSSDGLQWNRLPEQPALRAAAIHAVARTPTGYLAVGSVLVDPERAEAGRRGAGWTSVDGITWASMDPTAFAVPNGWVPRDGPTDVILRGIAAGERTVVIGDARPVNDPADTDVPPIAIAWVLDAPPTVSRIGNHIDDLVLSIVAVPGGFLAVTSAAPECRTGVWTSADGAAWSCAADGDAFADAMVDAVAASPGLEILVGASTGEPPMGVAWIRAP
jgi:hypothetical protein